MIVITNPGPVENEIQTIHALFEHGLELLHVRKPDFSKEATHSFLGKVSVEFRDRLVLHQFHSLAPDFGITRLHFTEQARKNLDNLEMYKYFHLSVSTHHIEDFNTLSPEVEYAFLSPVFESISKTGHAPTEDLLEAIQKRSNFNTRLIALGGMAADNIQLALEKGFDDVALLGAIWNSSQPIQNFKTCQEIVRSH